MNESIKQLLALQARDLELDRLQAELATIPGKIKAIKDQVATNKAALETAKKDLTQLQLAKKQKDLDLEAQESAIRKHTTELNSIKSNDAYKALLGEIDKAKKEKSALEDQILTLMDQTDAANKSWKEKEATSKGTESGLLAEIQTWEGKQKQLQEQMAGKQTERGQALSGLARNLAEPYERLRKNRKGATVVPLKNEQCSGCHMKVSQNLINEVRRGQKMMTCESCSRIVYLEESVEKQPFENRV